MSTPLPTKPNLEYDKKQAKSLLRDFRAGDEQAIQRFHTHHPRLRHVSVVEVRNSPMKLADAQLVIAHEYGFSSWARWKAHIAIMNNERESLIEQFKTAVNSYQDETLLQLLEDNPALREHINDPIFEFDSQAIVKVAMNRDMVDVLLNYGADINATTEWWAGGFKPLHSATGDHAEYLIQRGAKLDIHSACKLDKLDIVQKMVADNPDIVNAKGGDGQRPLHYATAPRIIDFLLAHGADIDARDTDHASTPAQWALEDKEKCRYLIDKGASVDIFMACAIGDFNLVKSILADDPSAIRRRVGDNTDPMIPEVYGSHMYFYLIGGNKSLHQTAKQFEQNDVYEYLLSVSPIEQQFIAACERADRETLQSILQSHPNIIDSLPHDDLRLIADRAWENDVDAVTVMLEAGFPVDVRGADESTPVDRASFHGFVDVVNAILPYKPSLSLKNSFGGTPLGAAIYGINHSWRHDGNHIATIEALVEAGAPYDESWLPSGHDAVDAILRKGLDNR